MSPATAWIKIVTFQSSLVAWPHSLSLVVTTLRVSHVTPCWQNKLHSTSSRSCWAWPGRDRVIFEPVLILISPLLEHVTPSLTLSSDSFIKILVQTTTNWFSILPILNKLPQYLKFNFIDYPRLILLIALDCKNCWVKNVTLIVFYKML